MASILSHLRQMRRQENHRLLLLSLVRMWPVAAGLCFACVAPQLRDMVVPLKPWGMWILFPFVSLAQRPELQFGGRLSPMLPLYMLYAQFPLEGLIARIASRQRVTFTGIAQHILFLHFLLAALLFLVS
jgi:hypothetical protein